MKILGVETSCDETAAAIIENGTKILSNVVASSQELHIKTGGIIPEVAAREQVRCIIPVINKAMKPCDNETIDVIAVTIGPGLIGSLLVGVETAKTLAFAWNKPIIPVNHLLAHIYANWLQTSNSQFLIPNFPAIVLIASGGHTELILMKGHGKFKWIGGTRDDAAGEAFDKIGRVLGLGYPGGPAIAAAAAKYQVSSIKYKVILPRPMIDTDDFDFSFSGLKTAVIREINSLKTMKQWDSGTVEQLAHETQEAIADVLVEKTSRAAKKYKVKTILLAGGVAANQRLREKILRYKDIKILSKTRLFIPEPRLCTDNAACVASCAFFNFKATSCQKIQALPSLGL